MRIPPIETPPGQNWSCHNCGGCCRQHLIEITEEERARIDTQNWTATDKVQLPVYLPHGAGYRLAHTEDGACVFLDERGLCRIHAKFGEEAKPLACRIFPYAFHPGGKKIALSLRFSCPSVIANRGEPLSRKMAEIAKLAQLVVPAGAERIAAPRLTDDAQPEWPDFFRFQAKLLEILQAPSLPLPSRLIQALRWLDLIEDAGTAALAGGALDEVLAVLAKSARSEAPRDLTRVPGPSRAGRSPFRLLLMQYARKDTGAHLKNKGAYRWILFKAGLRFSLGLGSVPALQSQFKPVPFAALEKPFGGLPPAGEEILTRYIRVKILGIHHCGPAYYNIPFVEGFRHLALLIAATLWMARWLAAGVGRNQLTPDDIAKALAVTDHHHGYSPAFGSANFRRRVRMLTKTGDIPRFIALYAR